MKYFARLIAQDIVGRIVMVVHRNGSVVNFPGGKIEPGEDAKAAAIREAREEAGITVEDAALVHQGVYRFGEELWHGYYFHAAIGFQLPLNAEPDKFSEVALYPVAKIRCATREPFVLDALDAISKR